jgi:outer membrane protein
MKKSDLVFLCFITIVFSAAGAVCAENKVSALTLKQCLNMAQERSDELKIQSERQQQADRRLVQAKGGVLPDIRYKYSKYYRDTANGVYAGEEADSRLAVNQPLFYGFRKTEAITLSRVDIRREGFQYRNVYRALNAVVTQAFYAIVQVDADVANIQNTLKLLQDRVQELNERMRLGKSRESEILAVESQIATLRAQQESSRGDRAKAAESLSRLIGVDSALLALNDDTPPVEDAGPSEKYLEAVKSRPDIEVARQDAIIQSSRVRITKGLLLPTFNLDGSWYAARSGSLSGSIGSTWDTSLSLDIPLFQGGITRGRVNEELSRQRELEDGISLLMRDATAEVRQLYKALVSSLDQTAAYKDAYDKAEKSYQLQLRDYRFGLVNNLDVLQAMTMMLDARRNMDRTLIQVKSDKALLDIAVMK